jgi:3'(2'), 5'-bisphosphate nucleotidase
MLVQPLARLAADMIRTVAQAPSERRGEIKKSDGSWVTDADIASSEYLCCHLPHIVGVPVFSEEAYPSLQERQFLRDYWIIDPLDNTNGFVHNKLHECAINIALVINLVPIWGCMYRFDSLSSLVGGGTEGVLEIFDNGRIEPLPSSHPTSPRRFTAYKPYLHQMNSETADALIAHGAKDSLIVYHERLTNRLRSIIRGEATTYVEPRAICEWDLAAAFALVLAQGGSITDLEKGAPIVLNTDSGKITPFKLQQAPHDDLIVPRI